MELQESVVGSHSLNTLKALFIGVYWLENRQANRFSLELTVVLIDKVDEIVSLLLGLEVHVDLTGLFVFLGPIHYASGEVDIVTKD